MGQKVKETVVVLGASPKPERYSNMAVRLLQEYGHTVIPVNPGQKVIEGIAVVPQLKEVHGAVDTVTLYINPAEGERLKADIAALKPRRVIMNPGTESKELSGYLESAGIEVIEACTLVMLRTGAFEQ